MAGPYNFESQWKSARNLVLAANKQAAWQGTLADAALIQRQRFDGAAILELTTGRRSDEAYAGKGTAFATDGQVVSYDTKLTNLKVEADDWIIGWAYAFALGKDTVTGAAAPYSHALAFDESTRTAVPTTVYMEDTDDVKYKCPDMCVDDVTLTIGESGAATLEITMMGSGRQTIGAMAAVPALGASNYLLNDAAALSLNGNSLVGRHLNTTFKVSNQLEAIHVPGGGPQATYVRKGKPKFSFSTTIAAKDVDDIYTLFENDTPTAYAITLPAGTSSLGISIPVAHLKTTKLGFVKDDVVWQIEGDETTCFAANGNPPLTVTVVNGVATYLVGA